jgi:hypothetical protein
VFLEVVEHDSEEDIRVNVVLLTVESTAIPMRFGDLYLSSD